MERYIKRIIDIQGKLKSKSADGEKLFDSKSDSG